MTRTRKFSIQLFFIFCLLLLPVLACSTLTGDGGDIETVVEVEEPAQVASEDQQQEGAGESEAVEIETAPTEPEQSGEEVDEPPPADEGQVQSEDASESEVSPDSSKNRDEIQEQIVSALKSTTEVDAMRMHMVTEDLTSGLTTEVTLSFVRPDRYQMSSEGVEFIIIGDTTYMSSGDDQWFTLEGTEMFSTVESTLDAFAGTDTIEERQSTLAEADVNYEGKETINGVETLVYSFNEGLDVTDMYGHVRMWIGEDDGLLYKQEIESTITGAESRISMDFQYGSEVTIEPPL